MNIHEAAAMLNGRQYGNEITRAEEMQLEDADLVAVFGYGDDNCELRGAIHDELSAYNGGEFRVCRFGVMMTPDDDEAAVLKRFGVLDLVTKAGRKIDAIWGEDGYDWTYKTDIPHATFEILEGEDKYCRGIVFSIKDL